jgi:hypothetical protein
MGSRTILQVLTAVRGVIQDEMAPFRYSNADLMISFNEGLAETRRIRPDLFLDSLTEPLRFYTSADTAMFLPLPDEYFSAFVNFVAGRTQVRDDEFSADGRAAILIGTWGEAMIGRNRK